jgi:sterol desaturase/sphingolipid hydroxylase (fatty acid hydroxylase superfamily)
LSVEIHNYLIWVTLAAIIVLVVEVVAGGHKGVYSRKGEIPLVVSSITIGRAVFAPVCSLLVAFAWSSLLPAYSGALSSEPLWVSVPVVMLGGEFCFYWVHRWSHKGLKNNSLLWMVHRTHHSARYMNVAVWMRLNLFWYIIIPHAWTMGLAIYLGWGEAAGIFMVMIAIWNILKHSDFRWDDLVRRHRIFGPLFRAIEHIVVSPGIHHTHHCYGKDGASYRNFGVMFSLWDWVFGTLHIPEGMPHRYGIPGHDAHWLEELAYPLARIKRP